MRSTEHLVQKLKLTSHKVQVDGIYRHYKGGLYKVINIAIDEKTEGPVVVYKTTEPKDGIIWTRSLGDWLQYVNDKPRFTLINYNEVQALASALQPDKNHNRDYYIICGVVLGMLVLGLLRSVDYYDE